MPGKHLRRAVLAAICLGLCVVSGSARAVLGDITDDQRVTDSDVRLALRIAGGMWSPLPNVLKNGDVAGSADNAPDGRLDIVDAVRIMRAATGLDPFPAPIIFGGLTTRLAVTGDKTQPYLLPRAYWIRGTVSGPDPGTDPKPSASIVFVPQGDSQTPVTGAITNGKFVVPARSGTNEVFADFEYLKYGENGRELDYTARVPLTPHTLDVSADGTQDFTYSSGFFTTGTLSGSITAPGWDIMDIAVDIRDFGHASAELDGYPADSYTVTAPVGAAWFSVDYASSETDFDTSLFASFKSPQGVITSGGSDTANITLPALTTLQGTVTGPGDSLWIAASIDAAEVSVGAYRDVDDDGAYTLSTPAGPARVALASSTDLTNGYRDLIHSTPYTIPADGGTANFTLPALPALKTVTGTVTGGPGTPVANVSLAFYGDFPDSGSKWTAEAETMTDSNGVYSIQLPDGNYTVEITPPTPEGPPSGAAASRAKRHRARWMRR